MNATHKTSTSTVPSHHRPWLQVFVPTLCLLVAIFAGLWNSPAVITDIAAHLLKTQSEQLAQNTSVITDATTLVPRADQVGAATIAQHYMDALLKGNYTAMWSMLHPQVQAMWPSQAAFTTYWQNRFQHYTLQSIAIGKVHWIHHWVNQETMIEYAHVLALPVSLSLQPDQSIQQQTLAPPEDLHPNTIFQNLPFIVQRVTDKQGKVTHWFVLDGGPADLEAPILPPLQPTPTAVQVPILMYHHISDIVPPTALGMSLTVTPTQFAQQLDYLKLNGYHTITFNQLFDALYYGGPLPARPIILSFDDGYDDVYHFALPILQAHGFSGMFYIITGKVGWDAYLTWQQIRTMRADGMQIGSHTVHHVDMGSLLAYSFPLAQQELQRSQASLQQHLGEVIQQFCYPSGEPFKNGSLALRQQIVAVLAADGYVGATTDPGQSGMIQSSLTPLALLRLRVDGHSTFQFFVKSLTS